VVITVLIFFNFFFIWELLSGVKTKCTSLQMPMSLMAKLAREAIASQAEQE